MMTRAVFLFALLVWSMASFAAGRRDFDDCQTSDPASRIEACTRIVDDRGESRRNRMVAYFNRARAWRDKGELDRAIADFTEAIKLDPKVAQLYNSRGVTWGTKGELDRAIADFTEAIRLDPQYAEGYFNRAAAADRRRAFDRAIADYTEAARLDPQNSYAAIVGRGLARFGKGEFDRAIADFDEAIGLDADSAVAYFGRGRASRAKGDADGAIADFSKAISRSPKFAAIHLDRGLVHLYGNALAKALDDVNQAKELDPGNAITAVWADIVGQRIGLPGGLEQAIANIDMAKWPAPLLRLFLGQSTPSAVLAAAQDADATEKQFRVCWTNFYGGVLALRRGEKSDAARLYRLAAKDCPQESTEWWAANSELKQLQGPAPQSDPPAMLAQFDRLYRAGDFPAALAAAQEFEAAAKARSGTILYTADGKLDEAIEFYRRKLDTQEKVLGRDHADVANTLTDLAKLHEVQGKYADAVALHSRALETREKLFGQDHIDVAGALFNLGSAYTAQRKYGEAEERYRRALAIREKLLGEDDVATHDVRSKLYVVCFMQGKYAETEQLLLRDLRIGERRTGPDNPTLAPLLDNLIEVYRVQGKQREADEVSERLRRLKGGR
jgi:tetratricopeptide (TPR) repeat protein